MVKHIPLCPEQSGTRGMEAGMLIPLAEQFFDLLECEADVSW